MAQRRSLPSDLGSPIARSIINYCLEVFFTKSDVMTNIWVGFLHWLRDQIVQDVPEELEACEFDCRKPQCTGGRDPFTCNIRLQQIRNNSANAGLEAANVAKCYKPERADLSQSLPGGATSQSLLADNDVTPAT
jgi:hypothetical protein